MLFIGEKCIPTAEINARPSCMARSRLCVIITHCYSYFARFDFIAVRAKVEAGKGLIKLNDCGFVLHYNRAF